MAVQLLKKEYSIKELDAAILTEACGLAIEDVKAKRYSPNIQCILVLQALAKKLLGISGVAIGNNPNRAAQLGLSNETRDFAEERRFAWKTVKDKFALKAKLDQIAAEERFVTKLRTEHDPDAWNAVNELTEILSRRSMALHRAGLVEFNVDDIVADEAEQRDRQQGGTGGVPMEGTVAITQKGRVCVASQRWPVFKKRQRGGVDRLDFDVEVPR